VIRRRREFSAATKRESHARSGGICECCGARLGPGNIFYEHINPDAMNGEPSLGNCACLCKTCWRLKTDKYDRPTIAKSNHVRDRFINARLVPFNRIAGGRLDPRKRTMDGRVIERATGRPWVIR
jgi:hypothetical protein